MTGNRSLEDFLGGSGERDEEVESEATESDGAESGDESDGATDEGEIGGDGAGVVEGGDGGDVDGSREDADSADAVEPAAPTYRWDRGGAACERCGETVERRWADGGAFVCADCKEW